LCENENKENKEQKKSNEVIKDGWFWKQANAITLQSYFHWQKVAK
jgi:hypothetical protein